MRPDKTLIVVREDLAADADDVVSVVIVQEVDEDFFRHPESGVFPLVFARGSGKSETNAGQAGQPFVNLIRSLRSRSHANTFTYFEL
jgi:hypothetical protein